MPRMWLNIKSCLCTPNIDRKENTYSIDGELFSYVKCHYFFFYSFNNSIIALHSHSFNHFKFAMQIWIFFSFIFCSINLTTVVSKSRIKFKNSFISKNILENISVLMKCQLNININHVAYFLFQFLALNRSHASCFVNTNFHLCVFNI